MANHVCGGNPCADGLPVVELRTPEQDAWRKRLDEICRGVVARGRLELVEIQEKEAADAESETRRQEQMRANQRAFNRRKELERLQRDAALDTFCERYGFEQGENE